MAHTTRKARVGRTTLRLTWLVLLAAGWVGWNEACFAQGGGLFDEALRGARPRRQADPNGDVDALMKTPAAAKTTYEYPLTERVGPIMVKVASLEGDEKQQYAEALVRELRTEHRIEAYLYRFQVGAASAEQVEQYREEFKKQFGVYPRTQKLNTEPPVNWLIMAGSFPSYEDKAAAEYLKRVRKIDPKSLPKAIREEIYFPFSNPQIAAEERKRLKLSGQSMNPLQNAHLAQNPLIPAQQKREIAGTQDPKVLQLLHALNSPQNEPFTVYNLKKPWSIQVASFTGAQQVQKSIDGDMTNASEYAGSPHLQEAAKNAVLVCKVLRDMGYDSYVFHGQYASVVFVGGYDSSLDPRLEPDMIALSNVALGPQKFPLKPKAMVTPRNPQGR